MQLGSVGLGEIVRITTAVASAFLLVALLTANTAAQTTAATEATGGGGVQGTAPQHEHAAHEADADRAPWDLMVDGVIFGTVSSQGGPRGGTDFRSQNWFMGMAARDLAPGRLMLVGMASAEPATVGAAGYREIFQEGESYRGRQITDHQHPHNLIMQLSAAWRIPLGEASGLTIAGGPVGEPALGPVAFMHRASAFENPAAPLSHHIFDSTHVSMGVVTAGIDRGPFTLEGSVFRGREPDENRYRVELGALDSWSARLTFRPDAHWSVQASHGFLNQPELLEPGNQRRTNASVSWTDERDRGYTAITGAVGWNKRTFSTVHALLVEATHRRSRLSLYSRAEALTVETEILIIPGRSRPRSDRLPSMRRRRIACNPDVGQCV